MAYYLISLYSELMRIKRWTHSKKLCWSCCTKQVG